MYALFPLTCLIQFLDKCLPLNDPGTQEAGLRNFWQVRLNVYKSIAQWQSPNALTVPGQCLPLNFPNTQDALWRNTLPRARMFKNPPSA